MKQCVPRKGRGVSEVVFCFPNGVRFERPLSRAHSQVGEGAQSGGGVREVLSRRKVSLCGPRSPLCCDIALILE